MSEKLISILVPLYQDDKYLYSCINSILNQSYKQFEILILDRKPTINSEEIINSFKDSRIHYYKADISHQEAICYLYSIARGNYIKLFCADDIMAKNCLLLLANGLDKNNGVAIFSNMLTISEDGKANKGDLLFSRSFDSRFSFINYCLFHRNPLLYPTVLINKEKVGSDIFDIRFKQAFDLKIWLSLALVYKGELNCVEEPLVFYRLRKRQGNASGGFSNKIAKRLVFEQMKLIDFIVDHVQPDEIDLIFPDIYQMSKERIIFTSKKYIQATLLYYFLVKKIDLFYGVALHKKYAIDKLFDLMDDQEIRGFMQEKFDFNLEKLHSAMPDYFSLSQVKLIHKYFKMIKHYINEKGLKFTLIKSFHYLFR